jgi:hypothetical protein
MAKNAQPMLPGTDVESLPLFSGTPQQVTLGAKGRRVDTSAQRSFAPCRFCQDTGRVKSGDRHLYCTCEAGERAREQDRWH